jgi:hypothetical protein
MPWVKNSEIAGLKGYRVTRSGIRVDLYDAALQGLDTDGGRWALVCEPHGSILNVPTTRAAEAWWGHPRDWCDQCADL